MDESQALRALAERLAARLAGRHSATVSAGMPPQLVLGSVPDDWPADVPLPPDAAIIGAVCQGGTADESARRTHLFFDVPWDVRQVRAFYLDRLARAGWSPTEPRPWSGGFLHSGPVLIFEADLAAADGGMYVSMEARPISNSAAQMLMIVTVFPPGSLRPATSLETATPEPLEIHPKLPTVHLPPSTESMPSSGLAGRRVESSMVIHTDLDRATLVASFTTQLEQAVWIRQDTDEDGVLTWSTWSFTDATGKSYKGTLYVLRCPDPEQPGYYRLSLEAEPVSQR